MPLQVFLCCRQFDAHVGIPGALETRPGIGSVLVNTPIVRVNTQIQRKFPVGGSLVGSGEGHGPELL